MFVNEVFAKVEEDSDSVFSHALVQVPASIAYITCITRCWSTIARQFNLIHF